MISSFLFIFENLKLHLEKITNTKYNMPTPLDIHNEQFGKKLAEAREAIENLSPEEILETAIMHELYIQQLKAENASLKAQLKEKK